MLPSLRKLVLYGLIIVMGVVFAAPNFLTSSQLAALPSWLPAKQIALGLDLRGGAHLVLEIDAKTLRKDYLQSLLDEATTTLRGGRAHCLDASLQANAINIRCGTLDDASKALHLLKVESEFASAREVALSSAEKTITLKPTPAALERRERLAIEQSMEIVRKRVDAIGVAESTMQALGRDRILVQLPGVQDPAAIRHLLGSTAKLTFHRVSNSSNSSGSVPQGYVRAPDISGGQSHLIEAEPMLQGERLVDAGTAINAVNGLRVVTFRLDAQGAKQFAKITANNIGKPFAVVLDGQVLSAPIIQEPIVTGSAQISGHFSANEAASLAALLRAGALPVPLHVIDQGTVSADLGAEAIRMGAITGAAGMVLVLGFMMLLYGRWGLVANVALVVNVGLTLAIATWLGVTLTLPGIAGIVLGIGLSVDANVLINERIREETRKGRGAVDALRSGFKRAYAAIVDSNVTTLIATVFLFFIGSGPVQGFAITMALGIAISMFTAVSVVRAAMAAWIERKRPNQLHIGSVLPNRLIQWTPSFQFMRARYLGIGASIVLSIASVVLLMNPGLNYGVDFSGGIMIQATLPSETNVQSIRNALEQLNIGDASVQQRLGSESIFVRLEQPKGADDAIQIELADRAKAAITAIAPTVQFADTDIMTPKLSDELAESGVVAVMFASIAMLIYIWVRFEWHFAVGAIATMILDITKVMGFFALTRIEFNLTAVAALLTLIGYSVNDKVVVYDRMRENLKLLPELSLRYIIDRSINETLARSLYTSATAFLAMLPMALWGGAAVQSFAVPMVAGIAIAASSSVFIAAPILLFLGDWRTLRRDPNEVVRDEKLMQLP